MSYFGRQEGPRREKDCGSFPSPSSFPLKERARKERGRSTSIVPSRSLLNSGMGHPFWPEWECSVLQPTYCSRILHVQGGWQCQSNIPVWIQTTFNPLGPPLDTSSAAVAPVRPGDPLGDEHVVQPRQPGSQFNRLAEFGTSFWATFWADFWDTFWD